VAPRGTVTRPTSDRVREAMFSLIGPVNGARVVDLYAGSGALAIEALSRGAAHAVLIERSRPALVALAENLRTLGLTSRAEVIAAAIEKSQRAITERGPFDLWLIDPPYEDVPSVPALLEAIASAVAPKATIVLEHASKTEPPAHLAAIPLDRTRRYGDTSVSLYRPNP
jgi:16S rRNA (guanine966-N2)-methyltransferase